MTSKVLHSERGSAMSDCVINIMTLTVKSNGSLLLVVGDAVPGSTHSTSKFCQQSQQHVWHRAPANHETPNPTLDHAVDRHPNPPDLLTLPRPSRPSRSPECAQSLRPQLPHAAAGW